MIASAGGLSGGRNRLEKGHNEMAKKKIDFTESSWGHRHHDIDDTTSVEVADDTLWIHDREDLSHPGKVALSKEQVITLVDVLRAALKIMNVILVVLIAAGLVALLMQ